MSKVAAWHRHSYPVQSAPPSSLSPSEPAQHHNATATPTSRDDEPSHLPRTIRAVGDAQAFKPKGRTLIICLDGTGDKFDSDNSNIVHLVSCLKKDDASQVTYYQSGIGTYNGGGLSNGTAAAFDMAVGSGLGVHVRDAYRFLMQTYRETDKICIFGFSRGAYTARCLAGMLHKVGLLPAHNGAQVPFAYQSYKDDTSEGWKASLGFKKTFSIDVNVYFLGLFDSVASVGFVPRKLPLSSTPVNKPTYFRHAMGLDERRSKFKVCRYQTKDHISPAAHWNTMAEIHERPSGVSGRFSPNLGAQRSRRSASRADGDSTAYSGTTMDEKQEKLDEGEFDLGNFVKRPKVVANTDVLEVWFTGCHADVGGGAVKNEVRHKLSQIPFRWMIRQCFECDTGILFDTHQLAVEGLDVHMLWPLYKKLQKPVIGPPPSMMERYEKGDLGPISRRSTALQEAEEDDNRDGPYNVKIWEDAEKRVIAEHWIPEQVEDYFDALSPLNDQLVQAKGWWILELWPIKVRIQPKNSDGWVKKVAMNLGRSRPVQETSPNLHWTVQQRMYDTKYEVKARRDRNAVWRIVV